MLVVALLCKIRIYNGQTVNLHLTHSLYISHRVDIYGVAGEIGCYWDRWGDKLILIISWVIFNHARPRYETIINIKSNHALESSHGETAITG